MPIYEIVLAVVFGSLAAIILIPAIILSLIMLIYELEDLFKDLRGE